MMGSFWPQLICGVELICGNSEGSQCLPAALAKSFWVQAQNEMEFSCNCKALCCVLWAENGPGDACYLNSCLWDCCWPASLQAMGLEGKLGKVESAQKPFVGKAPCENLVNNQRVTFLSLLIPEVDWDFSSLQIVKTLPPFSIPLQGLNFLLTTNVNEMFLKEQRKHFPGPYPPSLHRCICEVLLRMF